MNGIRSKAGWIEFGFGISLLVIFVSSNGYSAQNSKTAPLGSQAQKPSSRVPGQKPPPPAIKVTTRLVQVSVIVHDKSGNPVTNLTQKDFAIFDDGHPQTVSTFATETNEPPKSSPVSLPPGVFSNDYGQAAGVRQNLAIILLDGLNTEVLDQEYAREQLVQFLGQLRPNDRVAIYTLGDQLHIVQDFTSDSASLVRAIQAYRGHNSALLAGSKPDIPHTIVPALNAIIDELNERVTANFIGERVRETLSALSAIAYHVAGIPGRKNLIWLSSSFPFEVGLNTIDVRVNQEHQLFSNQLAETARALTDADLAVYPVDASGLEGINLGVANAPGGGFVPPPPSSDPTAFGATSHAENLMTMDDIADRTGGRAFYNTNNIHGSIRRAIDDSRFTYSLGYYPTVAKWNGEFHSIKIKVDQPGFGVRSRRGYFALPDIALSPKQIKEVVEDAVASPLDATGIPLYVHVVPELSGPSPEIVTQVHADAHAIRFEEGNGRKNTSVEFGVFELNGKRAIVQSGGKGYELHLPPEFYEQALKLGLRYQKTLPLDAKATMLRVVVRDDLTGAVGSVTVPLDKVLPATKH